MKKKEIKQTAIFFSLLYWLLLFLFLFKSSFKAIKEFTFLYFLALIFINVLLILISKFLTSIFKVISLIAKKVGNLIFLIISSFVFFVILTPISFVLRLKGKIFIDYKTEKDNKSYFKKYIPSEDIKKQY